MSEEQRLVVYENKIAKEIYWPLIEIGVTVEWIHLHNMELYNL
jgi:hypothetical protein